MSVSRRTHDFALYVPDCVFGQQTKNRYSYTWRVMIVGGGIIKQSNVACRTGHVRQKSATQPAAGAMSSPSATAAADNLCVRSSASQALHYPLLCSMMGCSGMFRAYFTCLSACARTSVRFSPDCRLLAAT